MSHFCGLVVLTPDYAKNHDLEDSLSRYDESREVEEYSCGKVSDYDKVRFIEWVAEDKEKEEGCIEAFKDLKKLLSNNLISDGVINAEDGKEYERVAYKYCEKYAELFKEKLSYYWEKFGEWYEKYGGEWNSSSWRLNYLSGEFEEYSTYNKDSKWDWYANGGRWSQSIKTKDGQYVDECYLDEIDWTEFSEDDYKKEEKTSWNGRKYHELKEGIKWHYNKKSVPFCLVVDGEWIEKGEMGWWGMTSNEMSDEEWQEKYLEILDRLPKNSEIYNVDFHI